MGVAETVGKGFVGKMAVYSGKITHEIVEVANSTMSKTASMVGLGTAKEAAKEGAEEAAKKAKPTPVATVGRWALKGAALGGVKLGEGVGGLVAQGAGWSLIGVGAWTAAGEKGARLFSGDASVDAQNKANGDWAHAGYIRGVELASAGLLLAGFGRAAKSGKVRAATVSLMKSLKNPESDSAKAAAATVGVFKKAGSTLNKFDSKVSEGGRIILSGVASEKHALGRGLLKTDQAMGRVFSKIESGSAGLLGKLAKGIASDGEKVGWFGRQRNALASRIERVANFMKNPEKFSSKAARTEKAAPTTLREAANDNTGYTFTHDPKAGKNFDFEKDYANVKNAALPAKFNPSEASMKYFRDTIPKDLGNSKGELIGSVVSKTAEKGAAKGAVKGAEQVAEKGAVKTGEKVAEKTAEKIPDGTIEAEVAKRFEAKLGNKILGGGFLDARALFGSGEKGASEAAKAAHSMMGNKSADGVGDFVKKAANTASPPKADIYKAANGAVLPDKVVFSGIEGAAKDGASAVKAGASKVESVAQDNVSAATKGAAKSAGVDGVKEAGAGVGAAAATVADKASSFTTAEKVGVGLAAAGLGTGYVLYRRHSTVPERSVSGNIAPSSMANAAGLPDSGPVQDRVNGSVNQRGFEGGLAGDLGHVTGKTTVSESLKRGDDGISHISTEGHMVPANLLKLAGIDRNLAAAAVAMNAGKTSDSGSHVGYLYTKGQAADGTRFIRVGRETRDSTRASPVLDRDFVISVDANGNGGMAQTNRILHNKMDLQTTVIANEKGIIAPRPEGSLSHAIHLESGDYPIRIASAIGRLSREKSELTDAVVSNAPKSAYVDAHVTRLTGVMPAEVVDLAVRNKRTGEPQHTRVEVANGYARLSVIGADGKDQWSKQLPGDGVSVDAKGSAHFSPTVGADIGKFIANPAKFAERVGPSMDPGRDVLAVRDDTVHLVAPLASQMRELRGLDKIPTVDMVTGDGQRDPGKLRGLPPNGIPVLEDPGSPKIAGSSPIVGIGNGDKLSVSADEANIRQAREQMREQMAGGLRSGAMFQTGSFAAQHRETAALASLLPKDMNVAFEGVGDRGVSVSVVPKEMPKGFTGEIPSIHGKITDDNKIDVIGRSPTVVSGVPVDREVTIRGDFAGQAVKGAEKAIRDAGLSPNLRTDQAAMAVAGVVGAGRMASTILAGNTDELVSAVKGGSVQNPHLFVSRDINSVGGTSVESDTIGVLGKSVDNKNIMTMVSTDPESGKTKFSVTKDDTEISSFSLNGDMKSREVRAAIKLLVSDPENAQARAKEMGLLKEAPSVGDAVGKGRQNVDAANVVSSDASLKPRGNGKVSENMNDFDKEMAFEKAVQANIPKGMVLSGLTKGGADNFSMNFLGSESGKPAKSIAAMSSGGSVDIVGETSGVIKGVNVSRTEKISGEVSGYIASGAKDFVASTGVNLDKLEDPARALSAASLVVGAKVVSSGLDRSVDGLVGILAKNGLSNQKVDISQVVKAEDGLGKNSESDSIRFSGKNAVGQHVGGEISSAPDRDGSNKTRIMTVGGDGKPAEVVVDGSIRDRSVQKVVVAAMSDPENFRENAAKMGLAVKDPVGVGAGVGRDSSVKVASADRQTVSEPLVANDAMKKWAAISPIKDMKVSAGISVNRGQEQSRRGAGMDM